MDVESILGELQVRSHQASVTIRMGHNFCSDRWIAIKLLLEFSDAVFHGVDVESILDEVDVWSIQARVTVRNGITFDPTVGSRSNFYWSFRMPFSLE